MTTPEPERQDGWRKVLRLALPLVVANSFLTLQIFIDRVMLAHYSSDALAASMAGAMVFWTLFTLPQSTAAYATTFVAQYVGAGRPERVGPAIWQALYFALGAGLLLLLIVPLAPFIVGLGGHSESLQGLEAEFLGPLAVSGLPALVVAAGTSFFTGRGETKVVLVINGVGFAVNALFDYLLIFGNLGFPELGMAGAGWATTLGNLAAALLTLTLLFRPEARRRFGTLSGRRFDADLFRRLMRFGLPSGLQWFMDGLVFTIFTFVIGRMGDAELAASSATITLNLLAILPVVGVGQAVSVLVGQRLGEDRPELAERATWSGFRIAWLYMTAVAVAYLVLPHVLVQVFHNGEDAALWGRIESLTPALLRFVAFYCLFDSLNLVFSFALKGAGDTRFVTLVATALAWPIVVLPTVLAWQYDWGVEAAWAFASGYVVTLGFVFLARFRTGRWKTMRVIEAAPQAGPETVVALAPIEDPV